MAAAEPLQGRRVALTIVGAASVFFALVTAAQSYLSRTLEGRPAVVWRSLAGAVPPWLFWFAVAPMILALAGRYPLTRDRWRRSVLVHLAAGSLLGLIHTALEVWVARSVYLPQPNETYLQWFRGYLAFIFHTQILTYLGIAGIGYVVDFYHRYREGEVRTSRLETQLAQAELQALKMQLHPHFLFNTLHAIGVLIKESPADAVRMVARLGDLLRLTLAGAGTQEVPLREEIEFLKLYMEIEQTRFQDRLTVRYDIAADALDVMVPNFILQPLVENAVRHGIAPRRGPGTIVIAVSRRNGEVEIAVQDDGPGMSQPNGTAGNGIGLTTTRERLRMLYGEQQRLAFERPPGGGLRVTLSIPATRG